MHRVYLRLCICRSVMSHHGVHEVFSLLSITPHLVMGKTELKSLDSFYPKLYSKVWTQRLPKIKALCSIVCTTHVLYRASSAGGLPLCLMPTLSASSSTHPCLHAASVSSPQALAHATPPSAWCLTLPCLLFLSLFLLWFVKSSASCICLQC